MTRKGYRRAAIRIVVAGALLLLGIAPCARAAVLVAGNNAPTDSASTSAFLPETITRQNLDLGFTALDLKPAFIDRTRGYAYFVDRSGSPALLKVALTPGTAAPRFASRTTLGAHGSIIAALADPTHGFAYLATNSSPAELVKVALGDGDTTPTQLPGLVLDVGENSTIAAAIDTSNGYAYVCGTDRVTKIRLGDGSATPMRIGSIYPDVRGEITGIAIDPASGHGWLAINANPSRVLKFSLGAGDDFPGAIQSVLTLDSGEFGVGFIAAFPEDKLALLVTTGLPAVLVNIHLGAGNDPPTRLGALELANDNDGRINFAVADPATHTCFLGSTNTTRTRVVQVQVGPAPGDPLVRLGAALSQGTNYLPPASLVLDSPDSFGSGTGYAYVGTSVNNFTTPNRPPGASVLKLQIGAGDAPTTFCAQLPLRATARAPRQILKDSAHPYAYYAYGANPARVAKLRLSSAGVPAQLVATLVLDGLPPIPGTINTELQLSSGLIDSRRGYAYFPTTNESPGRIVKIKLGEGDAPPTFVGFDSFGTFNATPSCGVLDPENGYGYWSFQIYPASVVKVALGEGDAPPRTLGTVRMDPTGENALSSAVLDPVTSVIYFGNVGLMPPRVVKVATGTGDQLPSRIGAFTLPDIVGPPMTASIDVAGRHVYFGGYSGIVAKVGLDAANPLRGVAPPGPSGLGIGIFRNPDLDTTHGLLYFPAGGNPTFLKFATGEGEAPPEYLGGVTVSGVIPASYFFADDRASLYAINGPQLTQSSYQARRYLRASPITIREPFGYPRSIRLMTGANEGTCTLSLYDDAAPRNRIWQSGPIGISPDTGFCDANLSHDGETTTVLTRGKYWLAWDCESTTTFVGYSYLANAGFKVPIESATPPATIPFDPAQATHEVWAQFLTYEVPDEFIPTPTPTLTPSPSPSESVTPTATATRSPTPSPSVSPTISPTPIHSFTPLPTETSYTPSPSPTAPPGPDEFARALLGDSAVDPSAAADLNSDDLLDVGDLISYIATHP